MRILMLIAILSVGMMAQDKAKEAPVKKQPEIKVDFTKVDALIKKLDAEGFRDRKNARKELIAFKGKISAYLEKAMAKASSPEVKEGLKEVLSKREETNGKLLNAVLEKKIQGNWTVLEVKRRGKIQNDEVQVMKLEKGKLAMFNNTRGRNMLMEGTYKLLQPTKKYNYIELMMMGRPIAGIIEIKGDKMRLYMNSSSRGPKPESIKDLSQLTVVTFKKGGKIPKDAKPFNLDRDIPNVKEPVRKIEIKRDAPKLEEKAK